MNSQTMERGKTQSDPQPYLNHGAHDLFDAHEGISGLISIIEHYQIYDTFIKDPELKEILQRQTSFITELYNSVVETLKTGTKPAQSTQVYKMTASHDVTYGLIPSQPKKPNTSPQEITDQCVSGYMLGSVKSASSLCSMIALEVTHPVLRRMFADSVPNFIEMAYEIFLYQNRHQYYQVPQLNPQDTNQLLQSFAPAAPPSPGSIPYS